MVFIQFQITVSISHKTKLIKGIQAIIKIIKKLGLAGFKKLSSIKIKINRYMKLSNLSRPSKKSQNLTY